MNRIVAATIVTAGVAAVSAISYKLGKEAGINSAVTFVKKTINEFNEDLANKRSAQI